ncbi:MAG: cell wall hydrolase [Bdellovibrionota bacterium]
MKFSPFILILLFTFGFSNFADADNRCVNSGNNQQCLVCACYHESKGEVFEGKVAVIQTILTRIERPDFPNTACGVVYQRNPTQFSWTTDNNTNTMKDQAEIADCTRAITEAKKRGSNGFMAFKAASNKDRWTWVQYCQRIGDHNFYAKTKAQCPSRSTASAPARTTAPQVGSKKTSAK